MREKTNEQCTLCAGQGCVTRFFTQKQSAGMPIPSFVMAVIYGLPLLGLMVGAIIGAQVSEQGSIVGGGGGLLIASVVLRSCQRWLNRLSLKDQKSEKPEHACT